MAALMMATIRELTDREEYADRLQDRLDRTRQLEDSALLRDSAGEDLRVIRQRRSNWEAAFSAGRTASSLGTCDGKRVSKAKFRKLLNQPSRRPGGKEFSQKGLSKLQQGRIHRRNMPPPPKRHTDLKTHLMGLGFLEAEQSHLQSYTKMHT